MPRIRLLVSGRVQGVGFRYATREQAARLGLVGWVKNLPDGNVETEFEGEANAVNAMKSWLVQGPAFAKVTSMSPLPPGNEPLPAPFRIL